MASRSGRSSSGRSSSRLLSYLSSNNSSAPPSSVSSKPRRSKAPSSRDSASVKESSPKEPPPLLPLREYRESREPRKSRETRDTRVTRETRGTKETKKTKEPREITPATILLSLIGFRLLNALIVRTFFQPDEFFQSLEPAWQLAFGEDQGAWMTWEWRNHLRSSLHPLLFAAVYRIAALLAFVFRLSPATRANLLIAAPKTAQAVIAAVGDFYTWNFARRIYGDGRRSWAVLALTVASPWQWFCSTRTLSNCLETTITIVALDFWPWEWSLDSEQKLARMSRSSRTQERLDRELLNRLRQCLFLAALACILRPTNVLVWMTLAGIVLHRDSWETRKILAREVTICGSAILAVSTLADRLFYGVWKFPPLKFLNFNIAQSLAVFYGKNDFHYYVSQGFPLLLTTALPFALIGLCRAANLSPSYASKHWRTNIQTQLAYICLAMPLVLSLISHKEVRFIYPLLPLLHILAVTPLLECFYPAVCRFSRTYTPRRLTLIFLLIINIFIALYTTIYHASGTLSVLSYLRDQHNRHTTLDHAHSPSSGPGISTGFLMPCHSTPWRSHMVYPSINAWALTCEPPVNKNASEKAAYVDEADQFYENPAHFLRYNMLGGLWHTPRKPSYLSKPSTRRNPKGYHEWPDYLVFFAQLEPTLQRLLKSSAYGECHRTFNTAWHDDWRRKGDVVVWCLDPGEQSAWKSVLREREERAQRKLLDFNFNFDLNLSPITQNIKSGASAATEAAKGGFTAADTHVRGMIRDIQNGKWNWNCNWDWDWDWYPAFLQNPKTQSRLSWPSWGKSKQNKTFLERAQWQWPWSSKSPSKASPWFIWDTKDKNKKPKGKRELWS